MRKILGLLSKELDLRLLGVLSFNREFPVPQWVEGGEGGTR